MPTSAPTSNIGAGTITCNYDGFSKHKTDDRRGRLRRHQLLAGGAGENRQRRLYRLGLGASPRTCPTTRLPWSAASRCNREGGAKRYRELKTESQAAEGGLMQWLLSFPLNAVAIGNNY